MKRVMLIVLLGLTVAVTAGGAGTPTERPAGSPPVAGVMPLGTTVEVTQAIAVGRLASKLIGAPVYNEKDEKVGAIDDLIITPKNSVSFAIVSVGGFLGLGERLVAIPVEQFRDEQGRLILPGATKEELKKLPEFQYAS